MTDFKKMVSDSFKPDAIDSMVARDLRYKRNTKIRQIFTITLLVILIILIIFNILILKQNLQTNDLIIQKLLDAFPKQSQ